MQIGDTYEYKNVVTKEINAGALGSGGLDIFATPFLICWMEAAAYYYMKEQLPEGKSSVGTMLIVAHRLSTIQHADNIIVLSRGRILEQGTHQQLLAAHGRYYQLYTLQYHKEQMDKQ